MCTGSSIYKRLLGSLCTLPKTPQYAASLAITLKHKDRSSPLPSLTPTSLVAMPKWLKPAELQFVALGLLPGETYFIFWARLWVCGLQYKIVSVSGSPIDFILGSYKLSPLLRIVMTDLG